MSSINKSGKRFQPKVKQRARRVSGLTTPVSSQTNKSSQPPIQTPINSQQQNSINTPLSPISQKVPDLAANVLKRTSDQVASENENERLSDVDELKEDTQESNNPPILKQHMFGDISPSASVATLAPAPSPAPTEPVPTISITPTSKPYERRVSAASSNTFSHPASSTMHRTRLNSLSIPTQLTNRRASVTSNNANTTMTVPTTQQGSRRGSFALPAGSRRGSINTGIGIGIGPITINSNPSTSRRGSVNSGLRTTSIPSTIENTRSGSINNERLNSLKEDSSSGMSIPIPLMKPNKKRRISVSNNSLLKNKDVSVGGIAIPSVYASGINAKKVSVSEEAEFGKGNEVNVTKERDVNDIFREEQETEEESSEKDKGKDQGKEKEKEAEAEVATINESEKSVPALPETPIVKRKMDPTEVEKERDEKWVYNRERKKYQLVRISALEDDPIKQQEFEYGHEVTSLSELTNLRTNHFSKLGNSLKFNSSKIKMSELCKPFLGVGEISQNYEKAMEGERKMREAGLKRKMIRENARKLRISEENVIKLTESDDFVNFEMDEKRRLEKVKELMENDLNNPNKHHTVPLLQIQDGKVTYSHESTVIDRHKDEGNVEMEKIEENPFENIITSNSYSKKNVTLKWTAQEVAELLRGVSLWGTDFGIIAQLFPHRTRKQVKAKFLLLEKQTPHLVEFALLRKLPADIGEYSGKTGKTFKSIDEYNKEIQELKSKHEEELQMMESAREQAHAEDRASQQTIHGSGVSGIPTRRSRKAVIAEFRKNEEIVGSIDN